MIQGLNDQPTSIKEQEEDDSAMVRLDNIAESTHENITDNLKSVTGRGSLPNGFSPAGSVIDSKQVSE